MWTADQGAERTKRVEETDLSQWEDNVAHLFLGT